ncbi:netrin-1-like [Salvelinus namaycush]|uniref:Netrin-1-like n=1 Tax=Salvelinus namaycush TaxID=8040 RepID=A0A8U0TWG4_SALNM|nr:netrin-1-like [Salvelinus namaycush]
MMFLPFSPLPSLALPFLLLLLTFLPPSLLSPSLSHSPLSWTSPHDPCYHLDGRPRHCLSEFINAAHGVPVSTAHSLRRPPDQKAVNVSSLTDLHNPHNLTCWTAQAGGLDGGDWVLTLPLGRRFEVTYISLQFCQQGEPSDPVSLSVLKSMDHGRTWRPMQHYSSDCPGKFGLQAQTVAQTRHQETEPLCSDPRPLQRHRGGMLLAFSTLDGRPSSPDFDYSPTLQDWVTATDIRLVFHEVTQGATIGVRVRKAAALALSDLQVGGRCKCNGHASRCRRDDVGRAVCVCEHHTAGADCDVCEDYYYDRPWQRATPSQPQPCVLCECNGHSSKCRFSMEVFQQSGRRSGGVCLKCRHHTAGRHCQYCQNGYTRDHSKPPTHRKTCQPCQCHPMGAVGLWCNQTSGQCLCRDGVMGLRCNRCAPGYKQGHSPLRPCIRIQEVAPTTPVYQPQYSIAEECLSYCLPSQVKVRMNLETYCLKDYVLKLQVRGMERSGPWWQFSIWIQTVFRTGSSSSVRRGPQALWVPDRDLGCGCPTLQVGRTFLLIGAEEGGRGPEERRLVADRSTLALQWREHWNPKLRGFRGQDKRGRCPTGGDPHRGHLKHHHSEYTPPHLVVEKETVVEVHPEHTNPHTHSHPHTPSESMKDMEEEAEHSVALDTHTHTQSSSHHRPETPQEQQQEQTPSPSTPILMCSTPV